MRWIVHGKNDESTGKRYFGKETKWGMIAGEIDKCHYETRMKHKPIRGTNRKFRRRRKRRPSPSDLHFDMNFPPVFVLSGKRACVNFQNVIRKG